MFLTRSTDQRGVRTFVLFAIWSILFAGNGCGDNVTSGNDGYPTRPITFLVPWSAGGMTDISSRALAAVLQQKIGTSVNVINRTGGGGVVGHLALSQARPDGYTIGAMTVEITMMHNMGLTPLTYKDYTPLALVINNAAGITVRADAPYETLDDLLMDIRSRPGEIQASGTSRGGIWDLARIGFLARAGLNEGDMPWVPSQGSAPALQELISGGVDVVTSSITEVDALRQAGQVKTLAVMSEDRLSSFPEVPTLKEQGIDYALGGWVTVAAPAGLDGMVRDKLEGAIKEAMEDPEFIAALTEAGSNIELLQGAALEAFLQEQHDKNKTAMETVGLAR